MCHSRKALRKHFCAYDLNGIILSTEGKTDAPVAAKVSLELFFLRADPCEGQANRQKDFCLREIAEAQFPCHSRKGEDVGFFVHGLVGGESLVSFANEIVPILVDQQIVLKDRLIVKGADACGKATACRFHIAVPMVDADNHGIPVGFHRAASLCFSLRMTSSARLHMASNTFSI